MIQEGDIVGVLQGEFCAAAFNIFDGWFYVLLKG